MRSLLAAGLIVVSLASFAVGEDDAPEGRGELSASLQARMQTAEPTDWLDILISFESRESLAQAPLADARIHVFHILESIPTVLAWAPASSIPTLLAMPGVILVENNDPIEYDMDTAIVAGNVAPLWASQPPLITLNGTIIDGAGVTVAVVDTGVNAQHPDIPHGSKVVRGLMAIAVPANTNLDDPFTGGPGGMLMWRETDNSDGNGHGSHIAGIVAGTGELSNGKFRGAAPGASLVGIGGQNAGGNAGSFWYAAAAWDWIYQNHDAVDPPVRIVTNSWGYTARVPCDPDITLSRIEKSLILEADIAMFFSVGNFGGDGSVDDTRTQFKCPWEGAIGVANYDDQNTGTRDQKLSPRSSRGAKDDESTWPDISAPGSNITATNGDALGSAHQSYVVGCQTMRDAGQGADGCYVDKSGTSMSTPFAAGVAALVLQVRPDLRPADLEYILEQTAYKFDGADDPYASGFDDYRYNGSHYARGHGLVDAEAAVAFAITYEAASHPVVYGEGEVPSPMLDAEEAAAQPAAEASALAVGVLVSILAAAAIVIRRP